MNILKRIGQYIFHSLFMSAVLSLSFSVVAEEVANNMDSKTIDKAMKLVALQLQQGQGSQGANSQQVQEMLKQLVGEGEEVENVNKMAGEILRKIASDGGGNAQSLIKKSGNSPQTNPEAFYDQLSPDQKAMVKKLSDQIKQRTENIEQRLNE